MLEKFGGNGHLNWSEDMRTILGTGQVSIAASVEIGRRMARQRNRRSSRNKCTRDGAADNAALHEYILVLPAREPRSIVKGSCGNGPRSMAKIEEPIRSSNMMNQICATLRALQENDHNRRHGFAPSTGKMGRRGHLGSCHAD